MKNFTLTMICLAAVYTASAQDFTANLQTARQSYSSGNLEGSRFAMEQMLQELDIITGKEVLKVLPSALGTLNANVSKDEVSGAAGFAGAVIRREYETGEAKGSLEIISNSPMISSVNAILSLPFIGTGSNGDRKVIKIEGYRALIQKQTGAEKPAYEIQVPLGSTLITLRTENYTDDIVKLANSIPVALIAQKLN